MEKPGSGGLAQIIEELRIHDHACLLYADQVEQMAAVIPFIKTGLERNERIVYLADDNTADQVIAALRAGGIDVDNHIAAGALVIAGKRDAYLREGRFDPESMIGFLKQSIDDAKKAGFNAMRATGEMTWALGPEPGVEKVIEYEAKLNEFIPKHDITAICQYNSKRFSAELLLGVVKTHPLLIVGLQAGPNPYYVPPGEFFHPSPQAELKRNLAMFGEIRQMATGLKQATSRYGLILDSIADGFFTIDRNQRFTYVNKKAALLMERRPDELLGKTLLEGFPDFDKTEFYRAFKEALAEEKPVVVEDYYRPFLGWCVARAYPFESGLSVYFADISKRKEAEKTIMRQQEAISRLSTPVLQIRDRMLVLPVIGEIDSHRARQLTEQMLSAIKTTRAKVVILDITGVPMVDSAIANHLIQAVLAARLLGAQVIVTGISAQNAQTLVRIGVDLSRIQTTGDLQGGIDEGDKVLGYEVIISEEAA